MAKKKMKKMESHESCEMDDKWRVESAARSLMEAEKVRGDKKLFASAKKELSRMSDQAKKAMR